MMNQRLKTGLAVALSVGVFAFGVIGTTLPVAAAELIMFRQHACEWCDVWDEEVGVVYNKTPEAKSAPLREVDIHDDRPADLAKIKPVVYTPTFVLTENGREIGRIIGYPGEDFFWGLLGQLLARVTPAACDKEGASCANQ